MWNIKKLVNEFFSEERREKREEKWNFEYYIRNEDANANEVASANEDVYTNEIGYCLIVGFERIYKFVIPHLLSIHYSLFFIL